MNGAFQSHVENVLGAAPDFIEPGKLHRFSTNGKRSDTSGWCKLFEDGRGGVFGDFRTGISDSWSCVDKRAMTHQERSVFARQIAQAANEREIAQQEKYRANAAYIADLLAATVEVTRGDPVARYFASRGLRGLWKFAPCLRLHPSLAYRHEGNKLGSFPAMVAPLQGPDGRVVALHRTYLSADGSKAAVPTVKKLTPAAGPLRGAAIRLSPVRDGVLGVAEGIETSMAAAMVSDVPVWSTYCAQGLANLHWPAQVKRLVIFGDADATGRAASEALGTRAQKAGVRTSVMAPRQEGMDWADVYAAEEARA